MMKILLDPQIFYSQRFGGISRYFTELYRSLRADARVAIVCPLFVSQNLHLQHYNLQPSGIKVFLLRAWNRLAFWSRMLEKNKRYTNYLLRREVADIFIPTYYDPYFLSAIGSKPFVLTVFDMIHELFPHYFGDNPTVLRKKLLMERATRIIAISKSTRQDIIRLYPHIDASKIHVVYLSHSIKTEAIFKDSGNKDYILFVGRREFYKNFTFFVHAVSEWLRENDMNLYCLGGGAFTIEEQNLINCLHLEDRVQQVTFKDNDLWKYYTGAFAFVFPSEYEGFGIPVLESMSCGCPVVLPEVSSLPEVAGPAGVYFELNNAASLVSKLELLRRNADFRKEIITLGFIQEKKFSWERTKEECLKVYELALQ